MQAGLQRRHGGIWSVEDVDVDEIHQHFVSLPLSLMFLIMWCVLVYLLTYDILNLFVTGFRQQRVVIICVVPSTS